MRFLAEERHASGHGKWRVLTVHGDAFTPVTPDDAGEEDTDERKRWFPSLASRTHLLSARKTRRACRTPLRWLLPWARDVFLPVGWPDSVTPDYTPYQVGCLTAHPQLNPSEGV